MREYGVPLIVVALVAVGVAGALYAMRSGRPLAMPWEEPEPDVSIYEEIWQRSQPGIAFE